MSDTISSILHRSMTCNICQNGRELPAESDFAAIAQKAVAENQLTGTEGLAEEKLAICRRRMSDLGGAIRQKEQLTQALQAVREDIMQLPQVGCRQVFVWHQYKDALICQQVLLEAMLDFVDTVGATRGSALYYAEAGQKRQGLEETFRFISQPKICADRVQEGVLTENGCHFTWRPVRPLPEKGDFFETVWRSYRENKNIY